MIFKTSGVVIGLPSVSIPPSIPGERKCVEKQFIAFIAKVQRNILLNFAKNYTTFFSLFGSRGTSVSGPAIYENINGSAVRDGIIFNVSATRY